MTLGGKGTAAQAAAADTELARGYHGYHGHYGWGGGYGYRGYYGGYYGGYRPYYGGFYSSYSFYRPSFYYSSFYRPYYYSSFYYPTFPVYSSYYSFGYGPSFYLGIGGGATSGAPAVTLGGSSFAPPAVSGSEPARPMAPPVAPDGTFPYDGGPANPVPLPKADPNAIPPANPSNATDLPISGKPKPAATPYKYKAYGEK
jgi:hypothetical protein